MNKKTAKISLAWSILLLVAFLEFTFLYLLKDREALTSSIYTYYFDFYYTPVSSGKLPWINFSFEYPPLAAYALLFPGLAPGLTTLSLTILRAGFCLLSSSWLIFCINNCEKIPVIAKQWSCALLVILALVVPGFYFGLFDWYLVVTNIMIAISLLNGKSNTKLWPWVALGSTIKLMPLLSIPFLFEQKDKALKSTFIKTLILTVGVNTPFLLFGFSGFKNFVSYHRMRSIDVFSSYACILNTLQNFGIVDVSRKWNFGALELQGSFSLACAKISLPLFGILFVGLLYFYYRQKASIKFGFSVYASSVILYTVVSKVSQSNYILWIIASLVSVWIVGYNRHEFIRATSCLGILLIFFAFFQDRFFSDFMSHHVSWRMIIVSSLRHLASLLLVILIIKEATACEKEAKKMNVALA